MLKLYVALHTHVTGLLNRDDRGATAVEYGLLVGLIALVIIAIVFTLGGHLQGIFTKVDAGLTSPSTAPTAP